MLLAMKYRTLISICKVRVYIYENVLFCTSGNDNT